ncbi:hypothetical protein ACFQZR_11805 [Paenibacillus sp. GCM10027629]|uniref:hypothetical protein n=1 Tax=Paenibacillus sp. GCM10027629 TaxID=3273414 RepID=UPI00363F05C0
MNIRREHWILIAILLAILIPFTGSYLNYTKLNVSDQYADEFRNNLFEALNRKKPFTMDEVTHFAWDRMHVFGPYLSREQMQQVTGSTWTHSRTYIGYIFEGLDDFPLLDESYHKLVFIHQGKVVLDITLDRNNVDFLSIKELRNTDRTRLIVEDGTHVKLDHGITDR